MRIRRAFAVAVPLLFVVPATASAAPVPGAPVIDTSAWKSEGGWNANGKLSLTVDASNASRVVPFSAVLSDGAGMPQDARFLQFRTTAFPRAERNNNWAYMAPTPGPGTGATGSVPVAGGSQVLRVGILSSQGAPMSPEEWGASLEATLLVRATTTLQAKTRGKAGARKLALSGRLDGAAGTPTGSTVTVQVRRDGAWKRLTRTTVGGGLDWKAIATVPRAAGKTPRLRTTVTPASTYPYLDSTGRTVRARLR